MNDPHIYTEEEIDLFLKGDRRAIDKLILTSLNALSSTFVAYRDNEFRPHIREEQSMKEALGDPKEVTQRRMWLDLQIKKEMDRAKLRAKILEASLLRVIPVAMMVMLIIFMTGLHEHVTNWLTAGKTTLPAIRDLKK